MSNLHVQAGQPNENWRVVGFALLDELALTNKYTPVNCMYKLGLNNCDDCQPVSRGCSSAVAVSVGRRWALVIAVMAAQASLPAVAQTSGKTPNSTATGAPTLPAKPKTAEDLYQEGRRAFYSNNFVVARDRFQRVLTLNPSHLPSQTMLKQSISILGQQTKRAAALDNRMKQLAVDSFVLDQATVEDALEFVRIKSGQIQGNGQKLNIVMALPPTYSQKKISVQLGKASLYEVLQAIAGAADLHCDFDQYAVRVIPRGLTSPEVPPAPQKGR